MYYTVWRRKPSGGDASGEAISLRSSPGEDGGDAPTGAASRLLDGGGPGSRGGVAHHQPAEECHRRSRQAGHDGVPALQ